MVSQISFQNMELGGLKIAAGEWNPSNERENYPLVDLLSTHSHYLVTKYISWVWSSECCWQHGQPPSRPAYNSSYSWWQNSQTEGCLSNQLKQGPLKSRRICASSPPQTKICGMIVTWVGGAADDERGQPTTDRWVDFAALALAH